MPTRKGSKLGSKSKKVAGLYMGECKMHVSFLSGTNRLKVWGNQTKFTLE